MVMEQEAAQALCRGVCLEVTAVAQNPPAEKSERNTLKAFGIGNGLDPKFGTVTADRSDIVQNQTRDAGIRTKISRIPNTKIGISVIPVALPFKIGFELTPRS